MIRFLTVTVIAATLVVGVVCDSPAQGTRKDGKQQVGAAKASPSATTTKSAPGKGKPGIVKYISCPTPECGMTVRGRSAKELKSIMKRHAKRRHKVDLSLKQLNGMLRQDGGK